ncbi:MAG: ribosomal protein L13e [Candidatus Bathyarchaeales archaeon]
MRTISPVVFKKGGKQRIGKGFSLGELKEAKLSVGEALKLGVPVDPRRRTTHEGNVKALKNLLETKRGSSESKVKGRKPKSGKEQK